jgi:hypothetical protein
MNLFTPKQLGQWLIVLGILGFIMSVIMSYTYYAGLDRGALPAVSFLFIMIGMCFYYPSLLEESSGQVSTMRVVVFSVVMVFVFITIKIGWSAGLFEEFTIDSRWVYILGLAFGGKAAQRIFEEEEPKGTSKQQKEKEGEDA